METEEAMEKKGQIEEILKFNKEFVEAGKYQPYAASRFPAKKLAVLSCMDTRLSELLPAALNLKNGDAKMIKNAGGVLSHPFGSVMRSLLVCVYQLGVLEIMVVGHSDCGMQGLDADAMVKKMLDRGVNTDVVELMKYCGVDFKAWLKGFDNVRDSVMETVSMIRRHPLMPKDVTVRGFIIDTVTGALTSC